MGLFFRNGGSILYLWTFLGYFPDGIGQDYFGYFLPGWLNPGTSLHRDIPVRPSSPEPSDNWGEQPRLESDNTPWSILWLSLPEVNFYKTKPDNVIKSSAQSHSEPS